MAHTVIFTGSITGVQMGPSRAFSTPMSSGSLCVRDVIDGGAGSVSGVAKKSGLPTAGLRIHLLDRATLRVVRRGVSVQGGAYSFSSLRPGPYIAVCSERYNPEIDAQAHDMIEAE